MRKVTLFFNRYFISIFCITWVKVAFWIAGGGFGNSYNIPVVVVFLSILLGAFIGSTVLVFLYHLFFGKELKEPDEKLIVENKADTNSIIQSEEHLSKKSIKQQKSKTPKLHFNRRNIAIGIGVFLLITFLTNPSPSDFKTFLFSNGAVEVDGRVLKDGKLLSFGRKYNFIIFSIYHMNYASLDVEYNYIGVADNFFCINTQ